MRTTVRRSGKSFIKTTVELEENLHKAVKDQGVQLSDLLRQAAYSVVYGNGQSEEQQIKRLEEEIQGLQTEISSKQVLLSRLQQKKQERIDRMEDERHLYNKYHTETQKKITPFIENNLKPDYQALCSDWKKRYFPENGLTVQKAEDVCCMITSGAFTFEEWLKLRNKELPKTSGGNN